jgi:hypothetical protein
MPLALPMGKSPAFQHAVTVDGKSSKGAVNTAASKNLPEFVGEHMRFL